MVRPRARGIKPGPFAWMSEGSCACGGPPTEGVLGPAFMEIGERCVWRDRGARPLPLLLSMMLVICRGMNFSTCWWGP